VFHVLKAWLVQLRQKLNEKKRFEEAFQKLHAIMYEDLEGTREEMILAVRAKLAKYKEAFASEQRIIQYINRTWEPKLGAPRIIKPFIGHAL
jgi:hypothetical protein